MGLKRLYLENFTVFEKLDIELSPGLNIFIGENGTGKTHIMKLLYSACQSVRKDISFSHKIVRVFKPDDLNICRLTQRKGSGVSTKAEIYTENSNIQISFSTRTKRWNATIIGEEAWEEQLGDLTSTFIPAKEILSNAWNLEAAVDRNNVDFDDTYVDIVTSAKIDISKGRDSRDRKKYLDILQRIISGKVTVENEKFYLKPGNQAKIEFQLVAEGIRKLALLWQLIKNGTLESGAVLFWDEPEANINPVNIPIIVEMLLELQRNGVQIFISTHDYFFAKYLELKRRETDDVEYHSLYKLDGKVLHESNDRFTDLDNNSIMKTFVELYENEVEKAMEQ